MKITREKTKEFNIGDKVYWAKYEKQNVKIKCPICFGKCEVVVILGNGDKVKTPCSYCESGFSGLKGYVEKYKFVSSVSLITIQGKEIVENTDGRFVEYRYRYFVLDKDDIFTTKDEAKKRVLEKIRKEKGEEDRRYQSIKKDKIMSLTWSVGYHQRKIREAKKQIKYHSKKVRIVKELLKAKK